jgi:uncharacterized membrane protein YeaQ/YmgE (transglycosylase-associated protein family)
MTITPDVAGYAGAGSPTLACGFSQPRWEDIMAILWTIIIGFIVGLLAKAIMPGRDPGGFIVTTLLGIAGALLAKFLGQSFGWYHEGQSAGFIASVVGAIILLALYRLLRRPSPTLHA